MAEVYEQALLEDLFQFPLLGFLLCIDLLTVNRTLAGAKVSIPFIGIFALHLKEAFMRFSHARFSFNSLYWDFCFASYPSSRNLLKN